MITFKDKNYIKYYIGENTIHSHIDAVHASPPSSDMYTGEIVKGVVERINCSGIIGTVSRTIADLNRPRSAKNKEAIDVNAGRIKDEAEACIPHPFA